MTGHKRWVVAGVCLLMVFAACGADSDSGTTTTSAVAVSSSTTPSTTSTIMTTPPSSPPGLILSGATYLTFGSDGEILTDSGEVLWSASPFPADVARDHQGGFAFADAAGLWWFREGAIEPEVVQGTAGTVVELLDVVPDPDGPVAVLRGLTPVFVRLADGTPVDLPADGLVAGHWIRRADNGLSVWVVPPEVELDSDGQPVTILQPARLVVADDSGTPLADIVIGSVYEAWARVYDFDGRTVIVSRGPFEPAMPEETFLMIDLATGEVSRSFIAAGTTATLVGSDVDWSGPVAEVVLGAYAPVSLLTDEDVIDLADGRYLAFLTAASTAAELHFDLAVWFGGNEANTAARDDGRTDLPVPNDYHIRNISPDVLVMPVAADVPVSSVWYDYETYSDLVSRPITYPQLLEVLGDDGDGVRAHLRFDPWWITVGGGVVVAIDEQYIP